MPVALAACGMTFGPTRSQLEMVVVIPLFWPSSPRYAPQGKLRITTSTGLPVAATPSSP
jgi:hypothetical protein